MVTERNIFTTEAVFGLLIGIIVNEAIFNVHLNVLDSVFTNG